MLALKEHNSSIYIPDQGFVAIGSGDEDWGWTRYIIVLHFVFCIVYLHTLTVLNLDGVTYEHSYLVIRAHAFQQFAEHAVMNVDCAVILLTHKKYHFDTVSTFSWL